MRSIRFKSFETTCSGRMVSSEGTLGVVFARNPYGTHNLVLVTIGQDEVVTFRHGNAAVLAFLANWGGERLFRKTRAFLALRGHESRGWLFPDINPVFTCEVCGNEFPWALESRTQNALTVCPECFDEIEGKLE